MLTALIYYLNYGITLAEAFTSACAAWVAIAVIVGFSVAVVNIAGRCLRRA